jgi:N-acetylmuramoyl-L-alanine amidase
MSTGKQFVELASKHIGEKYILGSKVPFKNANYTGPWDCAEFISWCVYQVSGLLVGVKGDESYTGFWGDDATTKCTKISIEEAAITSGAILLRVPTKAMMGHIVFSDGNNKTVEAMSTKRGVSKGEISGRTWHMALLINGVDYSKNSHATIKTIKSPTYNFYVKPTLMKDALILKAKMALVAAGVNPGEINDTYDLNMQIAIHNYQLMKGLIVDGIMGRQTLKSLKVI